MSWFSEQIENRMSQDEKMLKNAGDELVYAITGEHTIETADADTFSQGALNDVLKFYRCKDVKVPNNIADEQEVFEQVFRPLGILWREIEFVPKWYRNAIGVMVGKRKKDGALIAFLPRAIGGYTYRDEKSGKLIKLNNKDMEQFETSGYCFYQGFPQKELGIPDLIAYMAKSISKTTYVKTYAMTFILTLIGMLTPRITYLLYSDVVESRSLQLLIAIAVFYLSVQISTLLFNTVNSLISSRLDSQLNLSVEAATVARIYSLPPTFFRKYSAGELAQKMGSVNSLCTAMMSGIFSVGITSLFSLVYLGQVRKYASVLLVPSIMVLVATVVFLIITTRMQAKINERHMTLVEKNSGMLLSIISGIQKIKLSGSEKRVFARWLGHYAEEMKTTYHIPGILTYSSTITMAISSVGSFIQMYLAVKNNISIAEYTAFLSAFGMVSGAFMSLAGIASTIAEISPILHIAEPIMKAVPEQSERKKIVNKLNGNIELSHVSFRYAEHTPLVINDLSLKIKKGQYVAIVGKTGCGKSTLVRLLLGFENPNKGAVYYDGQDVQKLDVKSLRRNIGTVLQNGKLFNGDIYANITISAPHATLDDAWSAAEQVGLADDIREMPMGMHTMVQEGSGGISGGQRQRILIARAIVGNPKILIFDEATSALDNLTQKQVSDSLDALHCTRIVIAHRLSTIRQCDRILYLEDGIIKEDGSYEELMALGGKFADLVARQQA